jgi:hypothetical protein
MRRLFALGVTCSLVALPVAALAYFMQPSALLKAIEFDGRPRNFSMEAHARMDDTYVSFWANGEGEGRTADAMKGKWHATLDVVADDTNMRVKVDMLLHQQVAYVRLNELHTDFEDDVLQVSANVLQKKWLAIPLNEEQAQVGGKDAFIAGFVEGMAQEGIAVSPQRVEAFIDSLIDAILSLEHTEFIGGNAYSLRLKEGFVREILLSTDEFLREMNGEDLRLTEFLADPSIWEMESLMLNATNLHIRVNTNDEDDFQMMRFYLAVEHPALAGFSFVTQGETQRQMTPVYIGVPSNAHTMSQDELLEYLSDEDLWSQFGNVDMWDIDSTEWMDDEDTDEEAWDSGSDWWPEEEDTWTPRRRHQEQRSDLPCTGSPDSLEYLFLSRKGICPLVDRDRGARINLQESAKRKRIRAIEEERRQEHLNRVQSYQNRVEE